MTNRGRRIGNDRRTKIAHKETNVVGNGRIRELVLIESRVGSFADGSGCIGSLVIRDDSLVGECRFDVGIAVPAGVYVLNDIPDFQTLVSYH